MAALTCEHPGRQVQLQEARGEGCQDHARRGQQPTHQHHRATAKAGHEDAGDRTCGQGRVTARAGLISLPWTLQAWHLPAPRRWLEGIRAPSVQRGQCLPKVTELG